MAAVGRTDQGLRWTSRLRLKAAGLLRSPQGGVAKHLTWTIGWLGVGWGLGTRSSRD